jgi:hypothetical protein
VFLLQSKSNKAYRWRYWTSSTTSRRWSSCTQKEKEK